MRVNVVGIVVQCARIAPIDLGSTIHPYPQRLRRPTVTRRPFSLLRILLSFR